jgi:hypothetical protein
MTTFPFPLRYWMAASRQLTNTVHAEVARMIEIYYLDKAEKRGIDKQVLANRRIELYEYRQVIVQVRLDQSVSGH